MILCLLLESALAFAGTYAGIHLLWGYAVRHMLDTPNERSSHRSPTPRGGGGPLAIVVLVGLTLWGSTNARLSTALVAYLATGTLVAGLGWLDDVRSLRASTRLLMQSAIAAAFLLVCGPIDAVAVPFVGEQSLMLVAWPLSLLWIVGLTNAFNFMDGIDGIAGSQALVSGAALAAAGYWLGEPVVASLGALVTGASLGFLGHNWPPARIFMGDVGSTFLGFSFAVAPCLALHHESAVETFAVMSVAPFVLDTSITFARRLARGVPVWKAHREHFYQQLVISGWSHARTTLLYALLALLCSGAALAWVRVHARGLAAPSTVICDDHADTEATQNTRSGTKTMSPARNGKSSALPRVTSLTEMR